MQESGYWIFLNLGIIKKAVLGQDMGRRTKWENIFKMVSPGIKLRRKEVKPKQQINWKNWEGFDDWKPQDQTTAPVGEVEGQHVVDRPVSNLSVQRWSSSRWHKVQLNFTWRWVEWANGSKSTYFPLLNSNHSVPKGISPNRFVGKELSSWTVIV